MNKANPLSSPMMGRTLNIEKDYFRPKESNEEDLGAEVPYLNAIGALMYLANYTRSDIAFAVNLLAKFSSCPTKRHWKGIKHIFRYLRGTSDLGLFYSNNTKPILLGYADARYLSDPHNAKSQTGYIFTYGNTAISWRSQKQTIVATSSNHAEVIPLHEASKEYNAACVTRMKEGYIKSDRTKHIPPKFFSFTQELERNKDVDIQYIRSSDNVTDLFTKALSTSIFKKHVQSIGMRHLRDL
ncbi:secreted RxLR effector protein 161-like [Vicia villosa]|uniref:secreted RxLR effector protein 161-like n=1 Tax=Vicia villosa TaxID=3911 RepID=UPI00273A8660|nr:secreted RxLR effector protein 161-like [Vicia villosa]